MWVGRDVGGRPAPAGWLLRRAVAALLGRPESDLVPGHRPGGVPLVRVGPAADPAVGPVEVPVSVSRAGGVVVVAVRAGGPVGVDVERVRPLPALELARRWYDPVEVAWLAGRPAAGVERDFLRLWTAKEAVGKALGVGLRGGGPGRRVPLPDGPPLRPVPGVTGVRVGHPVLDADLVVAVAVAGVDAEVEVVVVEETQRAGHGVPAVRSAATERTSFPVVVRGN